MAEFLEAAVTELLQDNPEPTLHQLLLKTSEKILRGDEFLLEEKIDITDKFLNNISDENEIKQFLKIAKVKENERNMYPLFFVPPDSPVKRMTINGAMPRTHLFSANSYELEILRILFMWRSDDERVKDMLIKTKNRLKMTPLGEVFDRAEYLETSIAVLRFLALAFPEEKEWIDKLFIGVRDGEKRTGAVIYYYFLMLSEIHSPEIDKSIRDGLWHFEKMINQKPFKRKYKHDNIFEPVGKHIVRNCLLHLPEFQYLKNIKSYVGEDGYIHIDDAYLGV